MGSINVMLTEELTEREAEQLALLLRTKWTGSTEDDEEGWRKFIPWFLGKELGEVFRLTLTKLRHGKFHRKHMLMEQIIFKNQERFTQFDPIFRDWLKIGAGFVVWAPGPKGGIVPLPKSIDFERCDQDEFEKFHGDVIDFLQTEHCQKALWPHLAPSQRAEMIHTLIGRFIVDWMDTLAQRQAAKEAAKPPTQYIAPPSINDSAVGTPGAVREVETEAA